MDFYLQCQHFIFNVNIDGNALFDKMRCVCHFVSQERWKNGM